MCTFLSCMRMTRRLQAVIPGQAEGLGLTLHMAVQTDSKASGDKHRSLKALAACLLLLLGRSTCLAQCLPLCCNFRQTPAAHTSPTCAMTASSEASHTTISQEDEALSRNADQPQFWLLRQCIPPSVVYLLRHPFLVHFLPSCVAPSLLQSCYLPLVVGTVCDKTSASFH
jgi:hypothetical protein